MSQPEDQVSQKSPENAGNDALDQLGSVTETPVTDALFDPSRIDILSDVIVTITIEIGRAQIKIRDLLSLTKGSVIELNKLAGEPVDVYANGKLISMGNIIKANDKYCVRLISIPDTKGESE